jgi:hypothetical protein
VVERAAAEHQKFRTAFQAGQDGFFGLLFGWLELMDLADLEFTSAKARNGAKVIMLPAYRSRLKPAAICCIGGDPGGQRGTENGSDVCIAALPYAWSGHPEQWYYR